MMSVVNTKTTMKLLTTLFLSALTGLTYAESVLKIGFMTDTHLLPSDPNCERVKQALQVFKAQGVELVIHGGDVANVYDPESYANYRRVFNEVFADVEKPHEIQVYGNHDNYSKEKYGFTTNKEVYEAMRTALGCPNADDETVEYGGYKFVVMPSAETINSTDMMTWAQYEPRIQAACDASPGKPVFVLEHVPPKDTVYNTGSWGNNTKRLKLGKYPQVVELSGHVHGSLRSDLYIWQGEFTVINGGCLQHWTGELEGVTTPAQKQSYGVLTLDVSDSSIVVKRWDVRDGTEIGANSRWIVPLPFDPATAPYNRERRTAAEPVPTFPAGSVISATLGATAADPIVLTFPALNETAMTYLVRIEGEDGAGGWEEIDRIEEFTEFWKSPAERGTGVTYSFVSDEMVSERTYRLSVAPRNQYGVAGAAISTLVVTPSGYRDSSYDYEVDYVESTGTQYLDTRALGRSGTKVEAVFEYVQLGAGADLAFMGSRESKSTHSRIFPLHVTANKVASGYGTFNYADPEKTLTSDTKYVLVSTLEAGRQELVLNGTVIHSGTLAAEYDTTYPMYLFADNVAGTASNLSKIRLYSLKIYQTDASGTYRLIRDFHPAVKSGEGVLYDAVESRLYRGSTALSYSRNFAKRVTGEPDYYVSHFDTDGTQILDTGIPAATGLKAEGDLAWLGSLTGNEGSFLGALGANSSQRFYMMHRVGAHIWLGYGTHSVYARPTATTYLNYTTGADIHFVSDFSHADGDEVSLDVNGLTNLAYTASESVDVGHNLTLFGANCNGTFKYKCAVRFYGVKIWQDGTLVRDFLPCVKDGKGALYDRVRNEVVFPLGDIAESACGHEVLPEGKQWTFRSVQYVESTGEQFVDSGVRAKSGVKFWSDVMFLEGSTTLDLAFCGAAKDTSTRFYPLHYWHLRTSLGYGAFTAGSATNVAQPGDRNVYESTLEEGNQILTKDGVKVCSNTSASAYDTERDLWIFALNNYNTSKIYACKARCYGLKLWQRNEEGVYVLVRDFRPVKVRQRGRWSEGVGAFYDEVSQTVFFGRNADGERVDLLPPKPGVIIGFK